VRLNERQRFIVTLGGLGVLVMLIVPPWVFTLDYQSEHMRMDAGYAPIFNPPRPETAWGKDPGYKLVRRLTAVRIDSIRLLIQVLATITGTAVIVLLFHRRHSNSSPANSEVEATAEIDLKQSAWYQELSEFYPETANILLEHLTAHRGTSAAHTAQSKSIQPSPKQPVARIERSILFLFLGILFWFLGTITLDSSWRSLGLSAYPRYSKLVSAALLVAGFWVSWLLVMTRRRQ